MPSRTRYDLPAMLLCSLLSTWSVAVAQTETDSSPEPADEAATSPGDVIYRKDAEGHWQTIRVGEEDLPSLRDLLQPDAADDADIPDYFISKLSIEGEVVNEWAALSARIEIHTVVADRWLRVPLRFDQGLLLSSDYSGDGEAAPAVAVDDETGLVWLIRGKGRHTLKLSLRVPLRRTASGSQLQLSLPQRSEFFGGELRLKLPPESFVEPSDTVHLLNGSDSAQAGQVHALLSADRIDLRWHPVVEEAAPISRTMTNTTIRLRNDRVQYAARQEIRLRSAGISHVDVRLPSTGFQRAQAVRLNDLSGGERQVSLQTSDREGWVRVPLTGVPGTFVSLDWLFEMPFDESTHQLVIDGLEVAGADDQSGTISIEGFDRHLMTRRPDAVEGVSRIGVDELPAAGAFANLAYRFQSGNYRLVLDVDPIESTFRATPIYVLELSKSRARLSTRFLMSIDEGQVDALSIVWPQFAEQGWTVEPLAIGGGDVRRDEVTELTSAAGDEEPPQPSEGTGKSSVRWLLKPSSPLTNQSQTGLTAERTLSLVDDQTLLPLHLPQVSGARTLPGICIVATADEVEATVTAQSGSVLTERRDVPEEVRKLLGNLGDQARDVFTLQPEAEGGENAIDVAIRVQDIQVSAQSLVSVEEIETNPQVTQRFDFSVEFGRLASVRLQVPEDVVGDIDVQFRAEALPFMLEGKRLPGVWRGTVVELTFPQPLRGSFQIATAPYVVPSMSESETSVGVPVITLADRPFESVRLVVPTSGTVAVDVADDRWTHLTTAVSGEEWITSNSVEHVEIELDHSLKRIPQRASISEAWIQSQIDAAGTVRTFAQYELASDLSRLVVRLPEDSETVALTWNAQKLAATSVTPPAEIAGQYLITLPERTEPGWLGITYTTRGRSLGWSQRTALQFPSFGNEVTIERTFWDLGLPLTHHLLLQPANLSPQYEWTRSGVVWRREALAGVKQMRSSFTDSGAMPITPSEAANTYTFETLGLLQEVQVESMSNALLVFLGAGLTLLASFLLLKVPAARNVWLWLVVGTVVAVASLWYLDAILLLLQPAAYGLLLPLAAVLLDRTSDHRSVVPETLSTGQSFDLSPPGSEEFESASAAGRDSVPSTLVRPAAVSDSGVR